MKGTSYAIIVIIALGQFIIKFIFDKLISMANYLFTSCLSSIYLLDFIKIIILMFILLLLISLNFNYFL